MYKAYTTLLRNLSKFQICDVCLIFFLTLHGSETQFSKKALLDLCHSATLTSLDGLHITHSWVLYGKLLKGDNRMRTSSHSRRDHCKRAYSHMFISSLACEQQPQLYNCPLRGAWSKAF